AGLVTSADILEFLAGCLIFRLYRRSRLHPAVGVAMLSASLLWLTGVIAWTRIHLADEEKLFEFHAPLRVLFYGVFSSLFLFGLMEMERTRLIRFARAFAAIGDWSYSIYLCHLILLELVARTMVQVLPDKGIWWAVAICLPLVLGIGWLSYHWLERSLIGKLYRRRS
ncbi:MAG: acyltransferase family protein, partial [Janthinobacterium lividum]